MTIHDRVQSILKSVPKTRDSDKELQIIYLQKSGMNLSPEQIALFKRMPSMETIRRTRQAIQEKGKYLASPEVEQARFDKFQEVKQNIKYNSATNTVEMIL